MGQYRTNGTHSIFTLVEEPTALVYPMPTWAQKSAITCDPIPTATPVISSDSYDSDLAQKTLDIASATLALLIVFSFGFAVSLYYMIYAQHPPMRHITSGADEKMAASAETSSNPMAAQRGAL